MFKFIQIFLYKDNLNFTAHFALNLSHFRYFFAILGYFQDYFFKDHFITQKFIYDLKKIFDS